MLPQGDALIEIACIMCFFFDVWEYYIKFCLKSCNKIWRFFTVQIPELKLHDLLPDLISSRFHFNFKSTAFLMTALLMKRYSSTHVVTITFGCKSIMNCFISYLSNSYVSPNNGLNGFPTRSQFDVAMDIAKAVTYWNDTFGTGITQMKILRLSYHSCKCFTITNSQRCTIYHSKEITYKKGNKMSK